MGGGTASGVTQVITFQPSGQLTGPILGGSCFTSSLAVWRSGVYRCMAGNQILDPCFMSALSGPSMICQTGSNPLGPGVRLMLSKPLPAVKPPPSGTHPWIVVLQDGVVCNVGTGTAAVMRLNGKVIAGNYFCKDGTILVKIVQGFHWVAERVTIKQQTGSLPAVTKVVWTYVARVYV
jgi:hypothetical protein